MATWQNNQDIGDEKVCCDMCTVCLRALVVLTWWQVVGELLAEGGWDAGRLLHEAQSAEVKAKLHSTTSQ